MLEPEAEGEELIPPCALSYSVSVRTWASGLRPRWTLLDVDVCRRLRGWEASSWTQSGRAERACYIRLPRKPANTVDRPERTWSPKLCFLTLFCRHKNLVPSWILFFEIHKRRSRTSAWRRKIKMPHDSNKVGVFILKSFLLLFFIQETLLSCPLCPTRAEDRQRFSTSSSGSHPGNSWVCLAVSEHVWRVWFCSLSQVEEIALLSR